MVWIKKMALKGCNQVLEVFPFVVLYHLQSCYCQITWFLFFPDFFSCFFRRSRSNKGIALEVIRTIYNELFLSGGVETIRWPPNYLSRCIPVIIELYWERKTPKHRIPIGRCRARGEYGVRLCGSSRSGLQHMSLQKITPKEVRLKIVRYRDSY